MEELETETTELKGKLETTKRSEIEVKSKVEAFKFDNELLQKRLDSQSKEKSNTTRREEEMQQRLEEL